MRVRAEQVAVAGPHGPLLRPTSLTVATGQLALVRGEPGAGHTAFGLALTGRMNPTAGLVTVDGQPDPARLRERSALVDAPGITAPEGNLTLAEVVAEELALLGRPARRRHALEWLAGQNADSYARDRIDTLPPMVRIGVLTELAARPDTRLLVLDTPDRHTGNTQAWWPLALRHAARGRAVAVLCSTSSARLLPVRAAQLGQLTQPAPLTIDVA
jgi:ABC-type multidrug transport system ATPase subunit